MKTKTNKTTVFSTGTFLTAATALSMDACKSTASVVLLCILLSTLLFVFCVVCLCSLTNLVNRPGLLSLKTGLNYSDRSSSRMPIVSGHCGFISRIVLKTTSRPPVSTCHALSLHERRQRERVAAILHAEDAQQEAVHEENDRAPDQRRHLLHLFVCYSRDLDGQGDGGKRKNAVCAC